ncbi:MAG: SPFH domain-containing protein, partial [Planctomycetota bacterium]
MRLPTRKGARSRAGSARATWLAALGATFAVGLTSSAFQVQEGTNVVVLRFGDPSRVVTEPGLHFKLPAPIDTLQRIDVRTHVLDPAPSEFLTLEQRNLEIDAFVAWRVRDPRVFLTSLRDRGGADVRIEQVLQSAVNDVLTETPLADIVSVEDRERELEDVAAEVTELVAKSCEENGYGVEVLLVGFERVTFHRDNMPAIESSMEEERR